MRIDVCGWLSYDNSEERPYLKFRLSSQCDNGDSYRFLSFAASREKIKDAVDFLIDIGETNLEVAWELIAETIEFQNAD